MQIPREGARQGPAGEAARRARRHLRVDARGRAGVPDAGRAATAGSRPCGGAGASRKRVTDQRLYPRRLRGDRRRERSSDAGGVLYEGYVLFCRREGLTAVRRLDLQPTAARQVEDGVEEPGRAHAPVRAHEAGGRPSIAASASRVRSGPARAAASGRPAATRRGLTPCRAPPHLLIASPADDRGPRACAGFGSQGSQAARMGQQGIGPAGSGRACNRGFGSLGRLGRQGLGFPMCAREKGLVRSRGRVLLIRSVGPCLPSLPSDPFQKLAFKIIGFMKIMTWAGNADERKPSLPSCPKRVSAGMKGAGKARRRPRGGVL